MKIFTLVLLFLFFIAAQVLFFTDLVLFDNAFCYAYIGILLLLPFEMTTIQKMGLGFVTGLVIDIFYNTLGIHAFACVFIMYLRPNIESIIASKSDYSSNKKPTLKDMGLQWLVLNTLVLGFVHHFFVFYLSTGFSEFFFNTLWKVTLSTLLTLVVFIIMEQAFANTSLMNKN